MKPVEWTPRRDDATDPDCDLDSILSSGRENGLRRAAWALSSLLVLAGCSPDAPTYLPGSLEWDRVAVTAETSEPLLSLSVREGDVVEAGHVLAELDPRRAQAQQARAAAEVAQTEHRLNELLNGARIETVTVARADLARSQAQADEARREHTRIAELRERRLVAQAELDRAQSTLRSRQAEQRAAQARLDELLHGIRPEQIGQAEAALAAAQANYELAQINLQRLQLRAPRAGQVEALPFEVGDRPPQGASVVELLVGAQPYARVYIPASRRGGFKLGDRFELHIEGVETPRSAQLRQIASEAAFTPYFALSGDDASQLVYRAELVLDDGADLPAGLPLRAVPLP